MAVNPVKEVLCVILGGGQGTRLFPLTKERCKPAVPLFGKHRLIDIPVSNCLNSDLRKIYVLTQFNSESLNKHISRTYKLESFTKGFVEIIAAEQSMDDTKWFQGTADAVRRCLKHFNDPGIKYVIILSGDQLYTMNLRDVVRDHIANDAEVTVACNYVKKEDASSFGIMAVNEKREITSFYEKPKVLSEIENMAVKKDGEDFFLGSMGIYMFNKPVLYELLVQNAKIDFGREIIPLAIRTHRTFAYQFDGYWRDIGTIKTFYNENLHLTDAVPPLDLFDESWQIFTRPRYLPAAKFSGCKIERSIVAEGGILDAAEITHSIIGLRLRVGEGTIIRDSIAMGTDYYETAEQISEDHRQGLPLIGIGRNCHIEKAIIDKNVRIGDDVRIVNTQKADHFDGPNYFIRDGIVIISKNTIIPSGTVI
ncbi:MAG: glucose-1-phosphate adenylyltransferase [Candidatus Omnitrophica bacterium]|nr:glucose-1-phosphate adenylyltransferase [Candidatus Omnitrophota bacterium]